ncbi:hypothetical protein [Nostoc sp. LPT]|nr:hypothetical protein [Nostoc sp. LPT]
MTIDLLEFFKATDPSRTLYVNQGSDKKYYILTSCTWKYECQNHN